MPDPSCRPWRGENKILLSIDIGLTHSSVSFVYLENGANQALHPVRKWPGQGADSPEYIPTIVWYDANNKAVAFGAEARLYSIEKQAKDKGWFLAKGFKAQLYPEDGSRNPTISALPFGVSLRQVYSDFLRYLLKHTQTYFEDRFIDGAQLWESYNSTMVLVMSHPDSWGTREQSFLRDVAMGAGYATSSLAPSHIQFVTDTDASAYYYLFSGSLTRGIQAGDIFVLCDAGDSTTHISLHKIDLTSSIFKLTTCSSERFAGASSVNVAAESYIRQTLSNAGISLEDVDAFTRAGIEDFRKRGIIAFDDETKECLVQISNTHFENPALRMFNGCMVLPGSAVKSFFAGYIDMIRQAIDRHILRAGTWARTKVSRIFLVGYFGESSHLQRMVKKSYESEGCRITLSSNSTSRSVVDGALIWGINMNGGCEPRHSGYADTTNENSLHPLPLGNNLKERHFNCPEPKEKPHIPFDATLTPLSRRWEGDTKIVIGIDIGATCSGVTFSFLQKDTTQVVHRVTKWPGQEGHIQQSKIPTLVWYDTSGKAVSFGAEAQLYTTEEQAEDNGWFLAKYFKLHLHPRDMQTKHELKLDPLPPGVSLHQIYSDFLGYLLKHTRTYFEDRILDGKSIWERHSPAMEVIIAHPNGWGPREQHFLRQATTEAGFSTSDQASSKIRFVTEAEASVHFCIHHTSLGNVLRPGMSFAVCDAGGSTVDSTLYLVTAVRPILKLEEKRASACVQAGAIFVDFEVEKFLRKTLANVGLSEDDVDDYTKAGVKDFETVGKQLFGGELETGQNIRISHVRFNNATIGVRRGHMKLSSSTIKGFFDACVKEITGSVDQQLNGFEVLHTQGLNVSHILLVGGFGNSLHLRKEFKMRYEAQGCRVILTNDSTSWAVADGAVLRYASQSIFRRAPRSSLGIEASAAFDRDDPSHQDRTLVPSTLDRVEARGKWNCLVRKGVPIDVDSTTRVHFFMEISTPRPILDKFELDLYSFSGGDEPVWMRDKQGKLLEGFRKAAHLQASLEGLAGSFESRISAGIRYWRLEFYVCMQFGRTELEAYLEWEEMGCTRMGPCTIVPIFEEA